MYKIISLTLFLLVWSTTSFADDKTELKQLLDDFLSGQTEQHHDRFWADELIYTSSRGLRFGKADIMSSFNSSSEEPSELSPTKYSGEQVDIRLYDDIAIVAFVLVARESGEITQTYFNTGTFQKKPVGWQAIAWQATMIPKE